MGVRPFPAICGFFIRFIFIRFIRRERLARWRAALPVLVSGALLSAFAIPAGAQDCTGCSCKGGPGYRLTSGKCVSWAQHRKHEAAGDFPDGAACEHPQGCSLETRTGVKKLETGARR